MKNILKNFWAIAIALVSVSCFQSPDEESPASMGEIVINEVNTDAKYIELYNKSLVSVNIGGWTIHKNNEGAIGNESGDGEFVIPEGTVLRAKSYAIINCKNTLNEHSALDLGVSSSGVSGKKSLLLELISSSGKRVDYFVNTAKENPCISDAWDGAVEHSFTVACRMPDGGDWFVAESATIGNTNEGKTTAKFENTEVNFTPTDDDDSNESEGGDDNGENGEGGDNNEGGDDNGENGDDNGEGGGDNGEGGGDNGEGEGDDNQEDNNLPVGVGEVVINEVNTSAKYIELYNKSTTENADLGGWTILKNNEGAISDQSGAGLYVIPEGTILPAGGYAVLNCKGANNAHNALNLGVSNSGVSGKKSLLLELVNAEGERVDYFVNSASATPNVADAWDGAVEYTFDIAARVPDGGEWYVVGSATIGAANGNDPTAKFNNTEVNFDPSQGDNSGDTPSDNPNTGTSSLAESVKYVWNEDTFPEITLKVSQSEWNRMLQTYDKNNKTKQYFKGDVTFNNGTEVFNFTEAGWRLRGNTSRRRPEGNGGEMHNSKNPDWHHFHTQLNFRKYHKDDKHTIGGVRKMYLKWHKDDPMYVREMYCYDLFRRYGVWTAINDIYCRFYIHVEGDSKPAYFGVYEMQETVDDEYLEVRSDKFGGHKGNLWKCSYSAAPATLKYDTDANQSHLFGLDQDTDEEWTYELKTDNYSFDSAKAQLVDFMYKLKTKSGADLKAWLEETIDIPLLLKTYAVNVTVGMWDDYWNNGNNYYLYFNTSGTSGYKFYFIPYDYDNTLGTSASVMRLSDSGKDTPLKWGSNANHPLINTILECDPSYKELYKSYLKELVDASAGYFNYEASVARIRAWHNKIKNYVENDTGEDMSIYDQPASWGNHGEYRLLENSSNNFFKVKAQSYRTHLGY